MTESELRRLLLDAARDILAEPDTAFDLRKIAERAGKSRTAPYLVFGKTDEGGGLQALRLAVASEGLAELVEQMASALDAARHAEDGLDDLAAAYLSFAQENPRLFRLMFSPEVGSDRESPERPEYAAVRREHARLEATILRAIRMQAPGYLRDDDRYGAEDARLVASALWALLHGVATLSIDRQWGLTRPSDAEDPDRLARQILRFLTTASGQAMQDVADQLRAALSKGGAPPIGADAAFDMEGGAPAPEAEPPRSRSQSQSRSHSVMSREGPFTVSEAGAAYPRLRGSGAAHRASPPPEPALTSLKRARQRKALVEGAQVLWVDDAPAGLRHEIKMLEGLGASVLTVQRTSEALLLLDGAAFDLVISDIARHGDPRAGLDGLTALRAAGHPVPVIFYVGALEPERGTPPGAFGITDDADELLHLVFDVLERG